jgi:hypothetical protein
MILHRVSGQEMTAFVGPTWLYLLMSGGEGARCGGRSQYGGAVNRRQGIGHAPQHD